MCHVRRNTKTLSYLKHSQTKTAIFIGLCVAGTLLAAPSCEAQSIVDGYLFDPALGIDGDVNDTLHGRDGNDFLQRDTGIDTLNGNNGNDVLIGGLNTGADNLQDFLSVNQGADQFRVDLKYTKILVNGKWISIPSPEDSLLDLNAGAGDTTF